MRSRSCTICKGWHDLSQPWPVECMDHYASHLGKKRAWDFPTPNVRRDHMDALFHPANGQTYESRSDYDAVTKSRPDLIEVGTEAQKNTEFVDDTVKDDVLKAMSMIDQGYKPAPPEATAPGTGWVE